jgi:hypothetical protein
MRAIASSFEIPDGGEAGWFGIRNFPSSIESTMGKIRVFEHFGFFSCSPRTVVLGGWVGMGIGIAFQPSVPPGGAGE